MMLVTTPQPEWMHNLLTDLSPYEDRVVNHLVFTMLRAGELPIPVLQKALINFYPLIESFPKYMALNLDKVPNCAGSPHDETRAWLTTNIRQERRHAKWWRDFAKGFGVDVEAFRVAVRPPAEMDCINNYLWRVCTRDSLHEGLAASNYAVEGPTGAWTKNVRDGFELYRGRPGVDINDQTLAWPNAHALYDDAHPYEAIEIIKAYATSPESRESVKFAAMRTLEYYAMALDSLLA
jgi:pyrroloquinoline quinone (PQQ) biosynthesis protein C